MLHKVYLSILGALAIGSLILCCVSCLDDESEASTDYIYADDPCTWFFTVEDNKATITKLYTDKALVSIEIPSVVYDSEDILKEHPYIVKEIAFEALGGLSRITSKESVLSISIPASVEKIGSSAFSGFTALKQVLFEDGSSLKYIDNKAFYNCGSKYKDYLPTGL